MIDFQCSLKPFKLIFLQLFLIFSLNSCTGTMIGAGSSFGLAALEERSARQIGQDLATSAAIQFKLINAHDDFLLGISVKVFESRVLLTGILKNEELIAKATSLAWKTKDVKDVINQIQVGDINFRDVTNDTWITTQLITKITLDRNIFAINYKIATVNKVIYAIGIAQSKVEFDRVLDHAQNIIGVNRVINYVRVNKKN